MAPTIIKTVPSAVIVQTPSLPPQPPQPTLLQQQQPSSLVLPPSLPISLSSQEDQQQQQQQQNQQQQQQQQQQQYHHNHHYYQQHQRTLMSTITTMTDATEKTIATTSTTTAEAAAATAAAVEAAVAAILPPKTIIPSSSSSPPLLNAQIIDTTTTTIRPSQSTIMKISINEPETIKSWIKFSKNLPSSLLNLPQHYHLKLSSSLSAISAVPSSSSSSSSATSTAIMPITNEIKETTATSAITTSSSSSSSSPSPSSPSAFKHLKPIFNFCQNNNDETTFSSSSLSPITTTLKSTAPRLQTFLQNSKSQSQPQQPQQQQQQHLLQTTYMNEFFAGFIASIISTIILQPIEAIKTNQIANRTNILTTMKSIYQQHGLRQFYRTMSISCFAYGSSYGIYFPLNRYLKNENPFNIETRYLQYFMATIPPTLISLTLVNPLWVIKSVQSASQPNENMTILTSARQIYKNYGLYGFQRGLIFGYLNSINGVITFTLYDILKDKFNATTTLEYAAYSSLAKTSAYLISFPLFALRIRQQINQHSMLWNMRSALNEPIAKLYSGLSLTLVQMIPKTVIMLILYEEIIKCMN